MEISEDISGQVGVTFKNAQQTIMDIFPLHLKSLSSFLNLQVFTYKTGFMINNSDMIVTIQLFKKKEKHYHLVLLIFVAFSFIC